MHQHSVVIIAGAALPRYRALTRPRLCRQCGTEVSRSVKRCPTCGQPLSLRRNT